MGNQEPTGSQKRTAYAVWFCIALGVDLLSDLGSGQAYRPSLVGLAIMITAVLFFVYSWITER